MHIDEDGLLEYALDTVAGDDSPAEIEAHLEACPTCRSRLAKLQGDINVISSLRPHRPAGQAPRVSRWHGIVYRLLRAAALIVFGLAVGAGGVAWLRDEPVRVTPQYLTLSTPADSLTRYAASDATDVTASYDLRVGRISR